MSPIFDLQLDQGEKGPSGDVQSQEEMGVGEAIAIHPKLSTAIRCEHFWGGQEVVGLGRLLTVTQPVGLSRLSFVHPQLCIHAQNGRKCQYVGNCSFAHSPEERDMWTFMKENKSKW